MKIRGIESECRGNAMALAFKKSNYKLRVKKVSWPRLRGPRAVRVDCATGHAVAFVR